MTRRNWILVLVITGAFVVAGAIVIGGLVVIARQVGQQAKVTPDPTPLSEADKRLLLTAADIERLGGPAAAPGKEEWTAQRQGTGTRFITYLYESSDEPRITIYSRLALLPHENDARRTYKLDTMMMKLSPEGETYVPAPRLLPGGDDRKAWFIWKDREVIGNFFLVREGRFIQSARLTGVALHEPADVEKLLGPMLAESRRRTAAMQR
ncbi:MAG TPA: hypothetical protein VF266_17000 [Thermoanaerobaculia bacterium]